MSEIFQHPGLGKIPEPEAPDPEKDLFKKCLAINNLTVAKKVFTTEEALLKYQVDTTEYADFLLWKLPYQVKHPELKSPSWVIEHQSEWKI